MVKQVSWIVNFAVGILDFFPGLAMDGVMIWAAALGKAPSTIALNLGMTAVIATMSGMAVIHRVYVMNHHFHHVCLYMIPMLMN